MRAIAYLEWRTFAHRLAAILRSPVRMILWIAYALLLSVLIALRASPSRNAHAMTLSKPHLDAIAALYVGYLGLRVALAALGRMYAFRNSVEATFLSVAGLRPLEIVVWLHLRKLANGAARSINAFAYIFLLFAPRQTDALGNLRIIGVAALAITLQSSVELPAFLLGRGRGRRPLVALGSMLAAAGFGFGALAFLVPAFARRLGVLGHVYPGSVLAALLRGDALAWLASLALLGALVAIVATNGAHALPDLYAASQQTIASRRRSKGAAQGRARDTSVTSSPARRIPAGVFTLVWMDWVGFKRSRGKMQIFGAGCVASALCGVGAALAVRALHDLSPLLPVATSLALAELVLASRGASLGLANDLAKPLFWLSKAPLRARVAAWTFAHTWRAALAVGIAPLGAGLVAGNVALALAAFPLSFALCWSLQSLGVGLFALFPNPLDSRGPLSIVRTLVAFAYAIPPSVVASVAFASHATPLAAALGAAAAFAVEGWLAVELASLRFRERGASLATLARAA